MGYLLDARFIILLNERVVIPKRDHRMDSVKAFAERFVRGIVDEAVKQSSKSAWLIHCSKTCHGMSSTTEAALCWTPERLPAYDEPLESLDGRCAGPSSGRTAPADERGPSTASALLPDEHSKFDNCRDDYVVEHEEDVDASKTESTKLDKRFLRLFRTRHDDADAKRKRTSEEDETHKTRRAFGRLKESLCGVFKQRKKASAGNPFKDRTLPPVPRTCDCRSHSVEHLWTFDEVVEEPPANIDFAANIERVKDYGWYWGPMSSSAAEKILADEPDGSFLVRDSSDDRYIFSLTFRLNAATRHVRIEHGQGNFSFGNYTKFKSNTIVDFIESAVMHSRSGRYLFFLHRRPTLGPMRVQLLHPVSRFKNVHSLQHICRFMILKSIRKDLIDTLPLPPQMIVYLNKKNYYAEDD